MSLCPSRSTGTGLGHHHSFSSCKLHLKDQKLRSREGTDAAKATQQKSRDVSPRFYFCSCDAVQLWPSLACPGPLFPH